MLTETAPIMDLLITPPPPTEEPLVSPKNQLLQSSDTYLSGIYVPFYDLPYREVYQLSKYICGSISAFLILAGTMGNLVNIVVFVKLGLKDAVSISLLALSVSDLLFLSFASPHQATILYFRPETLPWYWEILYFPFYWYSQMFFDTSTLITVYTALARSACVVMPMKFKTVFSPKRTYITFGVFGIACFCLRLPMFLIHRIVSEFNPEFNKTTVEYKLVDDGGLANSVDDIVNRNILAWSSFVVVVISATIMIWKLQASVKFRRQMMSGQVAPLHAADRPNNLSSTRETRIIRSVVTIAVVFIVCRTPFIVIMIARRFDPRFDFAVNTSGLYPIYTLLYGTASNVAKTFAYLNSTVNFVIYLVVHSYYRQRFCSILKC